MANSRLEKIGTIFTRVTGLLRSGAMKVEDKPLWYNIYQAFPPDYQPKFDRPAPDTPIQPIFYEEDIARAKIHKQFPRLLGLYRLGDEKRKSSSQLLLELYRNLSEQNPGLDEDKLLELVSQEFMLQNKSVTRDVQQEQSLVNAFKEAKAKNVQLEDIFK